ncbi:MAG: helix-turn-helix transcriptional regulator [Planctomycetota bacterium]
MQKSENPAVAWLPHGQNCLKNYSMGENIKHLETIAMNGQELRQFRKSLKLSQAAFSRKLKISQSSLSRMEQSSSAIPNQIQARISMLKALVEEPDQARSRLEKVQRTAGQVLGAVGDFVLPEATKREILRHFETPHHAVHEITDVEFEAASKKAAEGQTALVKAMLDLREVGRRAVLDERLEDALAACNAGLAMCRSVEGMSAFELKFTNNLATCLVKIGAYEEAIKQSTAVVAHPLSNPVEKGMGRLIAGAATLDKTLRDRDQLAPLQVRKNLEFAQDQFSETLELDNTALLSCIELLRVADAWELVGCRDTSERIVERVASIIDAASDEERDRFLSHLKCDDAKRSRFPNLMKRKVFLRRLIPYFAALLLVHDLPW